MHPKEFKHEKAATGRLTHLCLANSELVCGVEFDRQERVQELIADPKNFPVLLHPGGQAINLSVNSPTSPTQLEGFNTARADRELVVFLIDATWAMGRKILNLSASLRRLPRIMFTPSAPSRFVIKQQPHPGCLSTLEATHELLVALERAGIDRYSLPTQLLGLLERMQQIQLQCAADPARAGYRRSAYKAPADRTPPQGQSGERRTRMFRSP